MGDRVGDLLDRLEVPHELRQVLEIAPEAVQLLDRTVDRDALEDVEAARAAERRARVVRRTGRIDPDGLVEVAVRRHAAPQQHPPSPAYIQPFDFSRDSP